MTTAAPERSFTAKAFDFGFGLSILLLMIGGLSYLARQAYIGYQRQQARHETALTEAARLPELYPTKLYVDVEQAFAAADKDKLRQLLTPDFLAFALTDLPGGPKPYTISHVSAIVYPTDGNGQMVHYRARDTSDDTDINEYWHVVLVDGEWRLNGITQAPVTE